MRDFLAVFAFHRRLGYSARASLRLAAWALNPDQPLYPEKTK